MKRWEYKILKPEVGGPFIWWGGGSVETEGMTADLNNLGRDGWELVSTFETQNTTGRTTSVVLLFKREITS